MNSTPFRLRTLAFGDLERPVWGAAWIADADGDAAWTPDADGAALAALGGAGGGGASSVVVDLDLSTDRQAGEWRLHGERASLTASPTRELVAVPENGDQLEGFDQLCRVTGRFELDGAEVPVDCVGLRTVRSGATDAGKLESVRVVAAWFEPDEGLALTALRARKAKAHSGDVITAAVFGPDGSAAVEDPRLTTTYEAGGWPIRAGLELWVGGDGEQEQQHVRRASGEATGAPAQATRDELDVRAQLFRWHSRGRDGAGIYILARRR
jgi:hypothetical protein